MFAVSGAANNYCAILAVYMEYMCVCHHGLASPAMVGGWVCDSCLTLKFGCFSLDVGRDLCLVTQRPGPFSRALVDSCVYQVGIWPKTVHLLQQHPLYTMDGCTVFLY